MKILLRRASSLARACEREAKAIVRAFELEPDIRFSAHGENTVDSIASRLRSVSEKTMQGLDEAIDLYRVQAQIRALIGHANTAVVDVLLAEREHHLVPAERTLNNVLPRDRMHRCDASHDAQEIVTQLTGLQHRLATVTTGVVTDSLTVSKLSERDIATIKDRIATIQRQQLDLNEQLAQENLKVSIDLSDDIVTVLRKHKII